MYVIIANLKSVWVSLFPFNTQDKIYRLLEVPLEKTLNIKQHELRQLNQKCLLHLLPAQHWLDISPTVRRTQRNILDLGLNTWEIEIWSLKIFMYQMSILWRCFRTLWRVSIKWGTPVTNPLNLFNQHE